MFSSFDEKFVKSNKDLYVPYFHGKMKSFSFIIFRLNSTESLQWFHGKRSLVIEGLFRFGDLYMINDFINLRRNVKPSFWNLRVEHCSRHKSLLIEICETNFLIWTKSETLFGRKVKKNSWNCLLLGQNLRHFSVG